MSAVFEATSAGLAAAPVPLTHGPAGRAIAFGAAGATSVDTFSRQVRALAATLPAGRHVLNLCEDRYRYLVAFCAAALCGQTTLMPPSRAPAVIEQVRQQYPDSYCITDGAQDAVPPHSVRVPETLPELDGLPLHLDDDACVAIGFTSGSTGQPRAYAKRWRSFRTSTAQNLAVLAELLAHDDVTHAVATVPPQHMYGMEMSVLLPLLGPVAVHGDRPLFPADVARALFDAPSPPLLITTPVHLRALVASDVALPPLAGIVSATAPLPPELAQAAETRFGCEVREVFGSTETCVIARRRTARDTAWTPLPGVRLAPQPDGTAVHAPHLREPIVLADVMEVHADGRFELRGRNTDLLEIAGKRASLGDLTRKLLAVPGVVDGVVFQLDGEHGMGVRRIAAFAVAPDRSEAQILQALRDQLDPVFLPRPLRRVVALPRNETGKLPRNALEQLLRETDAIAHA